MKFCSSSLNKTLDSRLRGNDKDDRAFTLVEMIVALGIFTIVAVVALGALVKIISANRKAQTLQASITNLNFALDSMSREMRVGKNYYCANGETFSSATLSQFGCSESTNQSGTMIAFTSSKIHDDDGPNTGSDPCNLIYVYRFKYDDVKKSFSLDKAQQSTCNDTLYVFSPIIDPNVTITGYYVSVSTPDPDHPYPLALIRVSGYAGTQEKSKTFFDVQTAVSSRVQ